jgi:glycosyltransferase involved in cell wall biosynthesis
MPPADYALVLVPSLTGLGGGIELYLRQFLAGVVRAAPDLALHLVGAREAAPARPALLDPQLLGVLRMSGPRRAGRLARGLGFAALAAAAVARRAPRLVVCGHLHYVELAAALARGSGAPLILLTYGVEAWSIRSPARRAAVRAADRVIAISAFTAAQLLRETAIAAERLVVVANAVDTRRFSPAVRPLELPGAPRPRLLSVARLDARERYKGIDVVIEALARAPFAGSYVVAGEGTDRPRLEALARARNVGCRFLGQVPDPTLPSLYRACDLFVLPSRNEGFGYVFLEAMASGLPVVAGSVDGSVDALLGGAWGRLVNPLDPAAVREAIEASLGDPRCPIPAEVERRFGQARMHEAIAELLAPLRRR